MKTRDLNVFCYGYASLHIIYDYELDKYTFKILAPGFRFHSKNYFDTYEKCQDAGNEKMRNPGW